MSDPNCPMYLDRAVKRIRELEKAVDRMLNTDSSDLETLLLAVGELAVSSGYFERKAALEADDE